MSRFLTIALILIIAGCEKKQFRKNDNSNVETVEELNQGDYQSVIDRTGDKKDLSGRERYYLASAYAMSGGVDVYSLYAVMEIQLFHKRALDWSNLSKEKNPYLKFMKNQEGIDYEKRQAKRLARWEKYLPKIKEKMGYREVPSYEDMIANEDCYCANATREEYAAAIKKLEEKSEEVNKLEAYPDDIDDAWNDAVFDENGMIYDSVLGHLQYFYFYKVYLQSRKHAYLVPKQGGEDVFGNVPWEMVYMNILWNTYEAIPLMKKLPTLSLDQQGQVTKSLEEYAKLLKKKEFKEVSIKNLMILTSVSLLSLYKESFDLDEVDSIQDLYCSFDPMVMMDNYSLIRSRLVFLTKAYKDSGIDAEEIKKYQAQLDAIEKTLPLELTQEQRQNHIQGVEKFKMDSCFNG